MKNSGDDCDAGQKLGCELKRAQAAVAELRLVVHGIAGALRMVYMDEDQSKANEMRLG